MSEFNKVEIANVSPTRCALCHTHQGPFVDVHMETLPVGTATGMQVYEGHIYLCTREVALGVSGCVEQLGYAAGTMVDTYRIELKQAEIDRLQEKIAKLEADLQEAIDRKTVSIAELRAAIQEQPAEPASPEAVVAERRQALVAEGF